MGHRGTVRAGEQKKKEYLKAKIDECETNSKIKILQTCTEASVTLRRVTNLELM